MPREPLKQESNTVSHAQSLRSFEAAEAAEKGREEEMIFLARNG
jgi:hypothetical protein